MMEPFRLTMDAARLVTIIDLPQWMYDQEVEVVVRPTSKSQNSEPKVKSVLGILKQYGNPELQNLEQSAWESAAVEKHLEKEII